MTRLVSAVRCDLCNAESPPRPTLDEAYTAAVLAGYQPSAEGEAVCRACLLAAVALSVPERERVLS